MSTNNCASVSKDDAFNIGVNNMIYQILKIEFSGKKDGDALKLEDLEKDVIDKIKDDMNHSFHVIMKNPMPSEELDNVVRDLCQRIEFEGDYRTTVSREEECFGEKAYQSVFISGLVSAIYYIEIRKTD